MTRIITTWPRLLTATGFGMLALILMPEGWRLATRLLVAWDVGTGFYLLLAAWMMAHSDIGLIRRRAAGQDEGALAILTLTTVAALASLAAIAAELATAKAMKGEGAWLHISLAGLTVFLSWMFMQTMYALHYAHEYYTPRDGGLTQGLEFPGKEEPDYWDFVYYSFVIGTATQTADVNITSRIIRRTSTVHSIVAFFFNTIILALTINISAGLL